MWYSSLSQVRHHLYIFLGWQMSTKLYFYIGSRWQQLTKSSHQDDDECISFSEILYDEPNATISWDKGRYEFFFQVVIPGDLPETMYTEHKRTAYQLQARLLGQAPLSLGKLTRTAIHPVAVKRVPYLGSVWETVANDMVNVTAIWRNRIEMSALGCSRVQRDDRPLQVRGVVRALEKGYRLTKVGFLLEERTRTRMAGCPLQNSSSVAACRYLKNKDLELIGQEAFDVELQIPKAYGKIQYDIKHGPVTVSHRLAFVVAVVDSVGRGTCLRLFTPLHIMPHDWVEGGYELPSYVGSFADRVLLKSCIAPASTVEQDVVIQSSDHVFNSERELRPKPLFN